MILCRVGGYSDSAVSGRKPHFFLQQLIVSKTLLIPKQWQFCAVYELACCSINFYVPNIWQMFEYMHVARFSPARSVASRLFPPCLQGRFNVRLLVAIFNCQWHHCFIPTASRSSLYISFIAFDCFFPSFPFFNPWRGSFASVSGSSGPLVFICFMGPFSTAGWQVWGRGLVNIPASARGARCLNWLSFELRAMPSILSSIPLTLMPCLVCEPEESHENEKEKDKETEIADSTWWQWGPWPSTCASFGPHWWQAEPWHGLQGWQGQWDSQAWQGAQDGRQGWQWQWDGRWQGASDGCQGWQAEPWDGGQGWQAEPWDGRQGRQSMRCYDGLSWSSCFTPIPGSTTEAIFS